MGSDQVVCPPCWQAMFRILYRLLTVLRRQVHRPSINDKDRTLLGAIAAALPRRLREGWIVTPETLLRWHRKRIARHWTRPDKRPGRPSTDAAVVSLIVEMATDNPTWGYRRIAGELRQVGHNVGASTVWRILKQHNMDPSPNRADVTWTQLLRSQAAGNLFLTHSDRLENARALVRDRGSQFVASFDEIFSTEGMKVLKTPVRTPVANTFAERWIGTLRRELLDRTIIWNQRQLHRLVVEFITHDNAHRPHRSLDQQPPRPTDTPNDSPDRPKPILQIVRNTRCDGLTNEYRIAA